MKKYILDLVVTQNIKLHANYVLIKLTHANPLPEMLPGQFAEIRIDGSNTTFLRRPISINYVDKTTNEVWFLVKMLAMVPFSLKISSQTSHCETRRYC